MTPSEVAMQPTAEMLCAKPLPGVVSLTKVGGGGAGIVKELALRALLSAMVNVVTPSTAARDMAEERSSLCFSSHEQDAGQRYITVEASGV